MVGTVPLVLFVALALRNVYREQTALTFNIQK